MVRQLVDDDRIALAAIDFLKVGRGTHHHAATPGAIAFAHAGDAVDDAGGREVGRGDDFDQLVDRRFRVIQYVLTPVDDFVEVVWRNIGGHADRDTRRPVDQQVGEPRGHDQRFVLAAVVVGPEIDGFLVEIGQQLVPDLGHADFGVTHCCRVIAVHGAEIALPVDQHVAQ